MQASFVQAYLLRLQMAAFSATTLARWQRGVQVATDKCARTCYRIANWRTCQRLSAAAHVARCASGPSPLVRCSQACRGGELSLCVACVCIAADGVNHKKRQQQQMQQRGRASFTFCVPPATSARGRQPKTGLVELVSKRSSKGCSLFVAGAHDECEWCHHTR